MVGIHRRRLAGVVAGFVRLLIVHIVRNAELGQNARQVADVVASFLSQCCELIPETVSNSRLAELDGKRRVQILSTEYPDHIDVPVSVPLLRYVSYSIVKVRSVRHP